MSDNANKYESISTMKVVDLEKLYPEQCQKFSAKKKVVESDKDPKDDDKIAIRMLAQDGFTYANELKKKYQSFLPNAAGNEARECEEKIKYYDLEMEKWTIWLQKYGSPISGIPSTTFDDIAGLDDVKETIKDYLYLLNNPGIAKTYNISTNLGILLYGPPGTGKTLIAEAIANALNVRYFVITPSQVFGSYVGESEKNVRDIFAELRACTDGAVLLIDECESIFARRDGNTSNRAAIGVANQLLQEMNGQGDSASRRVILGATNRPELMDEAYLRYKRFSMQFYIGMPDMKAKEDVVEINVKKRPYEPMFKEKLMLTLMCDDLYTCADISGIIEQCAYMALTECRKISEEHPDAVFGQNRDYIKMTPAHLESVLARYPRSVTREMLAGYEQFRQQRIQGK